MVKKENEEVTILHEENFVLWPEGLFSQYLTNIGLFQKINFKKNDVVLMKGKFWHEIFRPYETCFIFGFVFSTIFCPYGTTTFKHNDGK
ncbi:MAG: hypothetical protein Q8L81_00060 [Bacteroidota bacterium]|nr:hypothetical protein [Bacteroidota bacterium]